MVAQWQDRALAETDPEAALSALLALARQGDAALQKKVLERLAYWSEEITDEAQRLALYRVLGLTIIRMGEPEAEMAEQLAAVLTLGYPAASDALNRELVALLVALKSPDVLVKTIPLMHQEAVASETLAVDTELLKRSGGGRNFLEKPRESNPQRQQIWYAYALRGVESGWSPKLRKDYFTWFAKARNFKGGASFGGFLDNMRKEALERVADKGERAALDALSQKPVRAIPEGYETARKLVVGVKPGLKFDTELLEAKAGEKVAIEFVNNDPTGMMHNLAVVAPGSLQKVIAAAMSIGPKAMEQNFVPEIPEVLGSTPQVAPGRKYTLYVTVPNTAGDYPFVCTYPGHGQVMNGIMRVTP